MIASVAVGLVDDPIYRKHLTGRGHPECPARLDAIQNAINNLPLQKIAAIEADWKDILRCHTKAYVETVIRDTSLCIESGIHTGNYLLSTGDTNLSPDSLAAAKKASGGVIAGIDTIMQQKVERVFCLVRPPGHHAESSRGMGFCIFNHAAIGARYAQQLPGIDRVAIIDWDVHHGNGTQEIFYEDPSVFYFSTHQAPLYPGTGGKDETGKGKGKGTTLNCPIEAGKEARLHVVKAFREKLVPAMDLFKPDFVIISAGFDAHVGDPLGGFTLTDADFVELTEIVKEVANSYAKGRILSVLEGGYHLEGIASAAKAHLEALMLL